ncbi:MAG: succinate--CoA ligase subunit beta [Verrucomicrobia bacterium RIFCSPHIGHO2_12_FULL_41_10]|nr:MAG: succinate--CoA ligase subunit beta [Verrucomicrobia bacterium RIFCSPHIGHO2_12_FULL_41_10]HLB34526.1 ADP-forming succinate--CoA ligase subunit beta [Chthoniobacterales bacterium]
MNIHEYQAKQLFQRFEVATSPGGVATTAKEAFEIASSLKAKEIVVKAQIHAGGRGKGTFTNGLKGGVQIVHDAASAEQLAGQMLGNTLVTHQTGPEGKLVQKVLIAESVNIEKEFYFAILLDRETGAPLVIASTEGGVEIETVAKETPEKIWKETAHPLLGLQPHQSRKLARRLGFTGKQLIAASKLFINLYRMFQECDCMMLEINPLVLTTDGNVLALDAKLSFDDNALFRHPEILAMRDTSEEDPREVAASEFNLNYIGLDGNIACLVNGAGLAMGTMDIIKYHGGDPANFLDVGGGATEEQVTEAFKILSADPKVKAILVNIFGGIMRCDIIAQGIINAVKTTHLAVPLVVRLEGTNVAEGKKLLEESQLPLQSANDLADAAKKVVAAAQKTKE